MLPSSFHQRLESLQYNAALAITGAICGISEEKLYTELDRIENYPSYTKLLLTNPILIFLT